MFSDVFLMGTRYFSHVNIEGFCMVVARLLTLYGSDDGLANGRKLVTKIRVIVL